VNRFHEIVFATSLSTALLAPSWAHGQSDVEITPNISAVTASTNDGNVPGNAVDGNLATRWSANGFGQWLQLDLGTEKTVSYVKIAWLSGNTRTSTFDLQCSTGGGVWTDLSVGIVSSGATTNLETFDFTDESCRLVRYMGQGNSVNMWNSVTELEIWQSTGPTPPTPTPTPTSPSATPTPTPTATPTPPATLEITPGTSGVTASTNDGNVPANAVDNNLATRWSGNGDGAWLQLDLGATHTVTHITLATYNGNLRQSMFDLQVSSTATGPWTNILTGGITSGTTTQEETFDLPDTATRYLRYLGHMNTANSFNSVSELSVFGEDCTTCPTPTPTGAVTPTPPPTPTPTPTPPTGSTTQGRRGNLYTAPPNGFVLSPSGSEIITTINDTSGSIASVQTAINNARATNGSAVIVVNLQSGTTYTVSGTALVLGTRVCLIANGATIRAASVSATAPALIQIASGATHVSVAGGTLDGAGASLNGIFAPQANRVNIDKVTVRSTGLEGILLRGHGSTVWDNELTVTRCDVSGTSLAGISIQNATQALVIDNNAHDGTAAGIQLTSSARSSVVNNTLTNNMTGLDIAGNDNVISNNTCTGNGTGITAGGSANLVLSNLLGSNTTGIRSTGTGSTFADNLFTSGNGTTFSSSGSGNHVLAYKASLSASGQNYFRPVLVSDDHAGPLVNGMGRFDLTVNGTSLSSVQSQYNSARSSHPNTAIVLRLNGTFTGSGLTLSSNTSVLLNGTINSSSGIVVSSSGQANVSISGGIIDGQNATGRNAIDFSGRMMVVDGMNLRDFGARQPRRGGSDVVRFRGGSTPYLFIRNRMNNGAARGVWSQLSGSRGIYTDNDIANVNQDAIDLDSHTNAAVVKFNNLHDGIRSGVFVEEGARWNQAFGNVTTGWIGTDPGHADGGNGLWIWANASGPTEQNSYFCNRSEGNKRNIQVGTFGGTTAVSTENNLIFNNLLRNGTMGIHSMANGTQNYFSQNIVSGNTTNYSSTASATFFNSRDIP